MSEEKKKEGLNIELGEDIAQGTYSNLAIIKLKARKWQHQK